MTWVLRSERGYFFNAVRGDAERWSERRYSRFTTGRGVVKSVIDRDAREPGWRDGLKDLRAVNLENGKEFSVLAILRRKAANNKEWKIINQDGKILQLQYQLGPGWWGERPNYYLTYLSAMQAIDHRDRTTPGWRRKDRIRIINEQTGEEWKIGGNW